MNKHFILPLLAGALALSGCGKKEQAAGTPAPTPAPAPAPVVAIIELTANDSMKYNLTRFEVTAGQEVKVILTNLGTMPKVAMGHNFVLLKKGADSKAYSDAAIMAVATDYVPAALADQGHRPHQAAWAETERGDHI